MMRETVLALYDDLETAQAAVRDLVAAGYERGDVGLAVNDVEGRYSRYVHKEDDVAIQQLVNEDVSGSEGAGFGAIIGGLTGIVAGLTAIVIPGVGPIIAAGPLAAALGGATGGVIGAAAGAVTGGVTASLIDMGVPDEAADYYAESLRRGSALVTVTVHEERAQDAIDILRRHNPFDIEQRVTQWRMRGWRGFDPKSDPYTAVDLAEERKHDSDPTTSSDYTAAEREGSAASGVDMDSAYAVRRYPYRGEGNE
jgi:uncharacterized membrane protein